MGFKAWMSSYVGRPVQVADLIDLATVESDDPHTLLTSLYGWKYEHMTTAAKAMAGAGSAIAVATLVPLIQVDKGTSTAWGWLVAAWISSGLLILLGSILFSLARRVHAEFVAAQSLLAELIEVRSFIRLYRGQTDSL